MTTVSTLVMLFLSYLFFSVIVYSIKEIIVLKFFTTSLFYCSSCASSKSSTLSWPIKQETTWSTMRKKCCTMVITHQSGIHLDQSRTGVIVTIKVAAVSKWRDSDKTVEHKLVNWTLHTFRGELLPVYPHCPKYPLPVAIVIIKGVLRQLAEWSWEWNNGTEQSTPTRPSREVGSKT